MTKRSTYYLVIAGIITASPLRAQQPTAPASDTHDALTDTQWRLLDRSVDRGLNWLIEHQDDDGSFPSHRGGQPGITSLGVLAFLSRGHTLEAGPYAPALRKAIDFVLSTRKPDGLLCLDPVGPDHLNDKPSRTGSYNHAIAGLMLCEAYGASGGYRDRDMRDTIQAAIRFTLQLQKRPKAGPVERGGWRYVVTSLPNPESDLSATSWHLMFLRSARNAGFSVPSEVIDEALGYVARSFSSTDDFKYALTTSKFPPTTAMLGAGVLSLSLAGKHQTPMATIAGAKILQRRVPDTFGSLRFFYTAFYCTQAMFQLGDRFWSRFFPPLLNTLTLHQFPDGSWPAEIEFDSRWGKAYTTAMAVLCLTTPDHLLPIFQR